MEWFKSKLELAQKGLLYFRNIDSYFKSSDPTSIKKNLKDYFWDYPIDFYSLLDGIHFRNFDNQGVPIQYVGGDWVYSNSMILAYGLGCVQKYLRTGEEQWIDIAEIQAKYIYENSTDRENGIVLKEFEVSSGRHTGACSAMNQGEAASLFLRMYELRKEKLWLERAERTLTNYSISWNEKDGVGFELPSGALWLEEYPRQPLNHTLNGALFGIIGLLEVYNYFPYLDDLKNRILQGLEETLVNFDRSYWSNYHYNENTGSSYVASMKYHSLHIIQLEIIAEMTGSEICKQYCDRFKFYQGNFPFRLRAMLQIAIDKLYRRYV